MFKVIGKIGTGMLEHWIEFQEIGKTMVEFSIKALNIPSLLINFYKVVVHETFPC